MANALYFTALFAAGTELWTYPKWQERTQYIVPPFATDATPALTGMSDHQISAVRAFSDRIHSITSFAQRVKRLAKGRDNDSEGRRAWNAWVKRAFLKWKIVQEIEAVLMEEERHPRQLIGRQGFGIKVPPMEQVAVSDVYSVIAERLFGEDAFRVRHVARPIVKDELNKFISMVVAHVWSKMQMTVGKQYEQLHAGKEVVRKKFEMINEIKPGEKLDVSKMREWYQNVDRLKVLATSFSDESALEELGKQTDRINWVYKALTDDNSPAVIKGLSKNLREALKYMAMHEDIASLQLQLAEQTDRQRVNEDSIELDVEPQDVMEWAEGVEHLKTKTVDELYDMLGFEDRRIPFLVTEVDVESDIGANPRTDEEEEDVSAATEVRATQLFSLRWHQLVGVTKMVERALTSGPIMLMDDFSLGKTLQVLTFFAVMAYYRQFYSETKRYPGIWGTQEWTNFAGKKATLPECPFLFVVPPMLVDQVVSECNRFLDSGSFDVIAYIGGHETHNNLWAELEKRSSHSPYMRIYVASTTAVQSDSTFIHAPCIGTRVPKVMSSRLERDTIFGRRYLAIAIDEAHAFRNPNKVYTAMLSLREKTDLFVGMTVTPVKTRPSDLWHIGKVAGLPGFKNDRHTNEELEVMIRELTQAKLEDKKLLLERKAESRQALHRMSHGKQDEGLISAVNKVVDHNFRKENTKWITVVQEKYRGAVIRRTVNSLDHENKAISGLEPYKEHICLLKLYEHEYEALEALAAKALNNASESSVRCFSSENFHLSVRQCLLHSAFAFKNLYRESDLPNTYEGYRVVPSCKLNSLVEILCHHLSMDNAPGIEPSRQILQEAFLIPHSSWASSPPGSPLLKPHGPEGEASHAISTPDKIIVYTYFVTSFDLIQMVLKHHNIDVLTIDGKMSQQERKSTLETFKNSGHDGPRVLLISNIGSLGLNIAFANILIILDVLWSAISDQQLIERVWRHPQRKKVHVYRLIGGRSPDVVLNNNLSFSKGFIQDAFMNIGGSLRDALQQGDSDETVTVDTNAGEAGQAESYGTFDEEEEVKAKEQSEGRASRVTGPRAQVKNGKQASEAATSEAASEVVAAPVVRTVAKMTRTAQATVTGPDSTSKRKSKLTLTLEQREQAFAGPSLMASQKYTIEFPPSPKTMKDLPSSFRDLEEALPKFGVAQVTDDSWDSEDEFAGEFFLGGEPDFLEFIRYRICNIHAKRMCADQHENADLFAQLDERERMLLWFASHYERLGTKPKIDDKASVAPMPKSFIQAERLDPPLPQDPDQQLGQEAGIGPDDADSKLEPDPLFGSFESMVVDPPDPSLTSDSDADKQSEGDRSLPPSSVPPSPPGTRSITPSVSGGSARSKRSRELSSDEDSRTSSQKHRRGNRSPGAMKAGSYMQRASSSRSTPAQDEHYLTTRENRAGRLSKPHLRLSRRPQFIDDDSESIRDLVQGDKGGKGKGRAV